jgi:hypothetical protein
MPISKRRPVMMSSYRVTATILALATCALLATAAPAHAAQGTVLLFPFVSNTAGFDTAMTIANTNADPFGVKDAAGVCTLSYFSATGGTFASQTTSVISSGKSAVFLLSAGGSNGISARPGFEGYVIVDCTFPNARGFGFLSDIGARNLAANVPVEIIKRKDRH